MKRAVLALADGALFEGRSFGAPADSIGEVVFNTSMFGYQEILTDPSYVGQIVTMAYPEMGNVGANPDDQESPRPHSVGMVVRSVTGEASNWRSREELDTYLKRNGIAGIEGVDTRKLVRHLRNQGSQMGIISSESSRPSAWWPRRPPLMEWRAWTWPPAFPPNRSTSGRRRPPTCSAAPRRRRRSSMR